MFRLMRMFFGREEQEEEPTRAQKNFNLNLIECPFCHDAFTVHGMKRHWRHSHNTRYSNAKDKWDRWYADKKAETEEYA